MASARGTARQEAPGAGFRVERRDEEGWSFVHAWVPTPPTTPRAG